jgi:hypothetical protein
MREAGIALALGAALAAGCASRPVIEISTQRTYVEQDLSVEVVRQPPIRAKIDLGIPPNPYDDEGSCPCVCQAKCKKKEFSELEKIVAKFGEEADARRRAASLAVLGSGPDIVKHKKWKKIAGASLELMSNPTIVLVPMPGGRIEKVSLEDLDTLHLGAADVVSIRNKVKGNMLSALAATMASYGVPDGEAGTIAGAMMKVYLAELMAP